MNVRIERTTRQQKEQALEWVKRKVLPLVVKNVEAIILLQLHDQCGYSKQRLQRFLDNTAPMIEGILNEYNWDEDEDAIWFCKKRLKEECGIDLDEIRSPFGGTLEVRK